MAAPSREASAGPSLAEMRWRRVWAISWAIKIGAGLLFLAVVVKLMGGF